MLIYSNTSAGDHCHVRILASEKDFFYAQPLGGLGYTSPGNFLIILDYFWRPGFQDWGEACQ